MYYVPELKIDLAEELAEWLGTSVSFMMKVRKDMLIELYHIRMNYSETVSAHPEVKKFIIMKIKRHSNKGKPTPAC